MNDNARVGDAPRSRHDPLLERYEQADRLEHLSRVLDWLSLLAFASYAGLHSMHDPRDSWAKGAFISLAALAILLRLYFETWLQFEVDRERRLSLVSDSLGVRLTHLVQHGFWTSEQRPSFIRLLYSLAENTFFYPRLIRERRPLQILFVLAAVVLLVVSLRIGSLEFIELFGLLVLLGDGGLGRLLRMHWGIRAYQQLCDQCLTTLQRHFAGEETADLTQAHAVAFLAEYEVIKARCRIRVSNHVFEHHNSAITREWNELIGRLGLSLRPATD